MPACAQCQKPLEKMWPGRRFCNHACRGAYKSAMQLAKVNCAHCGKEFLIQPSILKERPNPTCGYSCAQAKRGRGMSTVNCAECGTTFLRKTSQSQRYQRLFCSRKCKGTYQSSNTEEMGIGPRLRESYPCGNCGAAVVRTPAMIAGRIFCSQRCSGEFFSGSNSPAWKDGASVTPYGKEFTRWLKYKVRKRDGFKCRICSCTHYRPHRLCVHHYDENKTHNQMSNLITLCDSCHGRVHGKSLSCPVP